MFSMDLYGNITANVGDTMLFDYSLRGKDTLNNTDKVEVGMTFNDNYKVYEFIPSGNKITFSGEATEKGSGTYSIRVIKEDGRKETTNIGKITVN